MLAEDVVDQRSALEIGRPLVPIVPDGSGHLAERNPLALLPAFRGRTATAFSPSPWLAWAQPSVSTEGGSMPAGMKLERTQWATSCRSSQLSPSASAGCSPGRLPMHMP